MNVLVTGSSRGIGLAIAKRFDIKGNKIVINGRDIETLNKATTLFTEADKIIPLVADISVVKNLKALFEIFESEIGGIDILINNAGIAYSGLFQDMDFVEIQNLVNVNLTGMLYCSRLAVPYMIKKKSGIIINISSIWGRIGASCEVVYSATKGGVNAFTKALAKELGSCNIRVNAIACGVIDTDMNSFLSDDEKDTLTEDIPLGRFGTVSEVADLAFFLASEQSKYLTGQIITLDGGMI